MMHNERRSALLVLRAGDNSLHPGWFRGPGAASRNWDLHVSYYGKSDDPRFRQPDDVGLTRETGAKFPGLVECLEKLGDRIRQYDYVGFPDDDIAADCETWNRFFRIIARHKPLVAQPALHEASFFAHEGLLRRRRFVLRWTNFVEIMTPVFSAAALQKALPLFSRNKSGWGQDCIWPGLFEAKEKTMCVVDAAPVLHTRAVRSGALYRDLAASGVPDPEQETAELLRQYDIQRQPFRVYGAVTSSGETVQFPGDSPQPLLLPKVLRRVRARSSATQLGPRSQSIWLNLSRPLQSSSWGRRQGR